MIVDREGDRIIGAAAIGGLTLSWFQLGIVLAALLVIGLEGLDLHLLAYVSPLVIQEWGVEPLFFSPAMAAGMGGMIFGNVAGGLLGDRYGRVRMVIISVLGFSAATIVAAMAREVAGLTLLRFISGIGFGVAMPNVLALATEWVPTRLRTQTMGWLLFGSPLGGIAAAITAACIAPVWGWRGCFVTVGVVGVIFGLAILKLPESPGYLMRKGRVYDAASTLGRLNAAQRAQLFEADEVDTRRPAVMRSSLFESAYLRVNLGVGMAILGCSYSSYAILSWLPLILTRTGVSFGHAVGSTIYYTTAAMISAPIAGWIINRVGGRVTGFGCLAGALAGISYIGILIHGHSTVGLGPSLILTGFCAGAMQVVLYSTAGAAFPPELRAGGIGMATAASRAGGVITIFMGGALLSLMKEPAGFFGAIIVSLLLNGVGLIVIDRHISKLARSPADSLRRV